jgi:hypothetical protein
MYVVGDTASPTAVYTPIQSTLSINDGGLGGNGSVTDGQLSFTIGTPTTLKPLIQLGYEEIPTDAQYATLDLRITDNSEYNWFQKMNLVYILMVQTPTTTLESMSYIYVDRDVTITGTGTTSKPGTRTFVTSDINMSLKKGWNAMYRKDVATTGTQNVSSSAANPSHLKWVVRKID